MKALVIESPGNLVVKTIQEAPLGPYDARCRTLYGATCAGTDLHVIDGTFCRPVDYPSVIGHESIGQVIEVGEKVRHYKVGDIITRVNTRPSLDGTMMISWGGMCEYTLACDYRSMWLDNLPSEQWERFRVNQVVPKDLIDPMRATMIITWRETLSYITRMGIGEGARVLVSGSGANGLSLAAMAKLRGASEVILVGSESREDASMATGIDKYMDYKDKDSIKMYLSRTGRSIDFLIDATGKSDSMNKFLPALNVNGVFGVYGLDDGNTYRINPLLAESFRFYHGGYAEHEAHVDVIEFLRKGKLNADIWLDTKEIFSIDDAVQAYEHVRSKKAIKAIVQFSDME